MYTRSTSKPPGCFVLVGQPTTRKILVVLTERFIGEAADFARSR